jgi:hypothetical protein
MRYPDFFTMLRDKRERLERHEMGMAESQAFRARRFAKASLAFGQG